MDRSLAILLSRVLFIASARAELQLSPRISEYVLDGVKFKQLAFADGVTYQSPRRWDYSGSSMQLTLRPPKAESGASTA